MYIFFKCAFYCQRVYELFQLCIEATLCSVEITIYFLITTDCLQLRICSFKLIWLYFRMSKITMSNIIFFALKFKFAKLL